MTKYEIVYHNPNSNARWRGGERLVEETKNLTLLDTLTFGREVELIIDKLFTYKYYIIAYSNIWSNILTSICFQYIRCNIEAPSNFMWCTLGHCPHQEADEATSYYVWVVFVWLLSITSYFLVSINN